jgi:uncharacterized protein
MSTGYFPPEAQQRIADYLSSTEVPEGCLDYIACHGFVTAMAIAQDEFDPIQSLTLIVDQEPLFQSTQERDDLYDSLTALHRSVSRQLYLGEELELPVELKAPSAHQTNELSDWCFGFMEAVSIFEDHWFATTQDVELIADRLIPMTIFSEPHVEAELLHLVDSDKKRQNLALEIPDNLQQLYLAFRD